MIEKKILAPDRIRRIDGGFGFIPHRFLTDGYLAFLEQMEIILYLFLCLVSDRHGISFYSTDAVCSLLHLTLEELHDATDGLIEKDLIAFDGTIYQVLDLPPKPAQYASVKRDNASNRKAYRRHVKNLIQQSLWEAQDDR
jgi:hypothetical protein